MEIATLGGGCFWCTEGLFKEIKGVKNVTSGYSGGSIINPTYEQVSSGTSGHAESIRVEFDPKIISYNEILYIFFKTHDPTTVNRQGNDVGSQYRSIIFYHNYKQKKTAEKLKSVLQKEYSSPIVTEIVPFVIFYPAEEYHRDYYENNPDKPYCVLIIDPKIKKLRKNFTQYLKKEF